MNKSLLAFAVSVLSCSLVQAQPVGIGFYEDLAALPFVFDNVQSYYVSSYDRKGGNDDGFRGTYSQLYVQDNGEHVIFEEDGPGCIYNIWFTGDDQRLHWDKMRIYVDGQETPAFESAADTLFRGESSPFVEPLVADSFISSGGFGCSAPIPFQKHLKITTENVVGFYNIYYQLYKNVAVHSWTPSQDYSSLIRLWERCGNDPKQVGDPKSIERRAVALGPANGSEFPEADVVKLDHPGTIQFLKINPLFKPNQYSLNHTYLRVYYDGADKPDIDVPVGPFFGSGLGEANVQGLFVGMSPSGTYYCYLPMPFRKSVRVSLQNRNVEAGGEFYCQVGHSRQLPQSQSGSLGYLGADYRRSWPIAEKKDYVLFDYQGRGAVVGQVMTVEPVQPDVKRWWEGDMHITIDGEDKPRFNGTGHEDEYQGGWSNYWLTNPYSLPLFGEPKTENLVNIDGQINGSTTMYRFWPGKIHFAKSISISSEHGNQNDTPANYSSLVYYYYYVTP
jgi:hypothetical protein